MGNNTSIQVNFGGDGSSFSASLSLDAEYNEAVYLVEKSSFEPAEIAYLKLIPGWDIKPYSLGSSFGNLQSLNKGIEFDVEEYLNFGCEDTKTLQNLPNGVVAYVWEGTNLGIPLFTGTTVTIPVSGVGRLKCTYKTLGDRLQLVNTDMGESEYEIFCAVCYDDGTKATLSVSFDDDSDNAGDPVNLEILVTDICSEEPIPNASVQIDGLGSGTTDANGIFRLGTPAIAGQTYDIKTTALNYEDSDVDFLNNDSFTVPVDKDAD